MEEEINDILDDMYLRRSSLKKSLSDISKKKKELYKQLTDTQKSLSWLKKSKYDPPEKIILKLEEQIKEQEKNRISVTSSIMEIEKRIAEQQLNKYDNKLAQLNLEKHKKNDIEIVETHISKEIIEEDKMMKITKETDYLIQKKYKFKCYRCKFRVETSGLFEFQYKDGKISSINQYFFFEDPITSSDGIFFEVYCPKCKDHKKVVLAEFKSRLTNPTIIDFENIEKRYAENYSKFYKSNKDTQIDLNCFDQDALRCPDCYMENVLSNQLRFECPECKFRSLLMGDIGNI